MDGVKDIVPQLLEAIRESYKSNVNRNILLQKLINIVKDNKGDYETLLKVSKEYGIALSDAFKSNVTGTILPDGKMYYNIAERLLNELLRENYDNVAPLCETVQSELNKQNGISLKAVKPSYKQEKVNGLIDYISEVDYEQREASFLDALITNSKSIVDDSVKENCEFQATCGMSPVIERYAVGKTCKWCADLAGTYQYPDELPDDVYKRHANCDCIVIYKPDKHAKDFQDVWSKKWNDEDSTRRKENIQKEEGRRGRGPIKEAIVDIHNIDSLKYRDKFDALDESRIVKEQIIKSSKAILKHRTGTLYEDLVFIDSTNGKALTNSKYSMPQQVIPTQAMLQMLQNNDPYTIIAIHNHPKSSVPSFSDLYVCSHRKYKYGIVVCHDSTVYRYITEREVKNDFSTMSRVNFLLDSYQEAYYNGDRKNITQVKNELEDRYGIILELMG